MAEKICVSIGLKLHAVHAVCVSRAIDDVPLCDSTSSPSNLVSLSLCPLHQSRKFAALRTRYHVNKLLVLL